MVMSVIKKRMEDRPSPYVVTGSALGGDTCAQFHLAGFKFVTLRKLLYMQPLKLTPGKLKVLVEVQVHNNIFYE